jgi:hypothetical protein
VKASGALVDVPGGFLCLVGLWSETLILVGEPSDPSHGKFTLGAVLTLVTPVTVGPTFLN